MAAAASVTGGAWPTKVTSGRAAAMRYSVAQPHKPHSTQPAIHLHFTMQHLACPPLALHLPVLCTTASTRPLRQAELICSIKADRQVA